MIVVGGVLLMRRRSAQRAAWHRQWLVDHGVDPRIPQPEWDRVRYEQWCEVYGLQPHPYRSSRT